MQQTHLWLPLCTPVVSARSGGSRLGCVSVGCTQESRRAVVPLEAPGTLLSLAFSLSAFPSASRPTSKPVAPASSSVGAPPASPSAVGTPTVDVRGCKRLPHHPAVWMCMQPITKSGVRCPGISDSSSASAASPCSAGRPGAPFSTSCPRSPHTPARGTDSTLSHRT